MNEIQDFIQQNILDCFFSSTKHAQVTDIRFRLNSTFYHNETGSLLFEVLIRYIGNSNELEDLRHNKINTNALTFHLLGKLFKLSCYKFDDTASWGSSLMMENSYEVEQSTTYELLKNCLSLTFTCENTLFCLNEKNKVILKNI